MTTYRDKWATLFNGGKGIKVIAISMDADTTTAAWAKEANLPMMFASDMKGDAGKLYGAYTDGRPVESRLLYVVGPDGKIACTAKPFNPMVEDAYTDLGTAAQESRGDQVSSRGSPQPRSPSPRSSRWRRAGCWRRAPKVGDMAPDFTLKGSTKDGLLPKPIHLADFRGQTVVLAFFPKSRTKG